MKIRLHIAFPHLLRRPALRRLLIVSGVMLLAGGLSAAAAIVEDRTKTIASHLGDWLHGTNHLRPKRGGIWEKLDARANAEAGLEASPEIALPEQGLPDIVRRNRVGYRRAPEDGPAGYAVVWMEEASGTPESRPIQDILESYRNFNTGLQIIKALHLPDTRYRARALADAAGLLSKVSPPGLEEASADSARSQVLEELSVDIIDRLRRQEQSGLAGRYHSGEIRQIELHQALGEYAGTLTLRDDLSRIRFVLSMEATTRIIAPLSPGSTASAP